jgi:phosphoribosyl 1,2-cyclic phosphate phosphodiesterase
MQIVILGSGSSIGVPAIGCDCKVCLSQNQKNHRSRSSILVKNDDYNLLVDTSPDLRIQALRNKITKVDAVFYTHAHADHVAGIDDLRCFNYLQNNAIDIYGSDETLSYLEKSYAYCFNEMKNDSWYKPLLKSNRISHGQQLDLGGMKLQFFDLDHGSQITTGFKIGNFIYCTDFKNIPSKSLQYFNDLELLIIDCLKFERSHGHLSLQESLDYIAKFQPRRAVLCHLAHEMDYEDLSDKVPSNVKLSYDGMIIDV